MMKIPKEYDTYKEWTLDLDRSGAIFYSGKDVSVYCSPNWEGQDGLWIEIHDYAKDTYENLCVTEVKITTPEQWFALVKPYLDKLTVDTEGGTK